MGLIEDALRGTFAAQVTNPPAVDDAAGRAIASAMRVRRRHTAVAAVATAMCVVLVTVVVAAFQPSAGGPGLAPAGPGPTKPPGTAPIPIAVLYDHRLILPNRDVINVDLPAAPLRAWRVKDGWIVETDDRLTDDTAPDPVALWFLPPAGGPPALIVRGSAVALSADGARVAWGKANRVGVADRSGAALINPRETDGTGVLGPLRFVGDGLLLGGPTAGVSGVGYDMWFPDRGPYVVGSGYDDPILAATADGSRLYALSGREYPCLVTLVPDGLGREHTACDMGLAELHGAVASPTGTWLALTFNDRIELYRSSTLWSSAPPTQTWFTANEGLTWLDDQSFVVSTGSDIARYSVDRPGLGDTFDVAPRPGEPGFVTPWVSPVPTLG